MRDTKSISLLVLSSVLLLLSIGLLSSLGYQYYRQSNPLPTVIAGTKLSPTAKVAVVIADSAATRDSLLKIYHLALNNFVNPSASIDTAQLTTPDSAVANANLEINLKEFYRLKDEIAMLLQTKSSNADMMLAKEKIAELQLKVELLSYRNSDVEKENKRLYAMLEKLTRQSRDAAQVYSVASAGGDGKAAANTTILMTAANLDLSARTGDSEEATTTADETETLVGSFTVSNKGTGKIGDIVVVVVKPNGQVLQKSAWESGAFETTEGKKIYSCKLRCDAAKGETKQLTFSISADNYQKGNYTLQLYHNGILIAKKAKVLS